MLKGECYNVYRGAWVGVLLGYKTIELMVGLFFAIESRNVKIKKLNDSKIIGFSVYTITVTFIALTPIAFFVTSSTTRYAILGLLVALTNTVILSFVFIPQVRGYSR